MTLPWKTVHVFISSTFNDMHAERDYLIKSVFPKLAEWCQERKLRLVDIDLRWGITEEDAQENKNVVKICLDRIDDCRPFFLCFLGQRRGWVPKKKHISENTLQVFPGVEAHLGSASITEMEILHALISPMHEASLPSHAPADHTFFYLREPDYLDQLPADVPEFLQIFTNAPEDPTEATLAEQEQQDQKLKEWREEIIPAQGRPVRPYSARWDPEAPSPELAPKAAALNADLTTGRLTNFRIASDEQQGTPLDRVILEDLKQAIAARFPAHMEIQSQSDLQRELDQQEQFLHASSEGFIARGDDFQALDSYLQDESRKPFILTAAAGMGKSTLLAKWIQRQRTAKVETSPPPLLLFRFSGSSDKSTSVNDMLPSLLRELKDVHGILDDEIPPDPQELRTRFRDLLEAACKRRSIILVIDALNQLQRGLDDLGWLPWSLPENLKLIVSFKRGEEKAEALLERVKTNQEALVVEVPPFTDLDDRRQLVNSYLEQYLKKLDDEHLEVLIQSPGAENPLYLKVVLAELRVFGVFEDLGRKIREDFGETPISAFQAVLQRLETDPAYTSLDPGEVVPLLFGLMAHARRGLSVNELSTMLIMELGLEDSPEQRRTVQETLHLFLRQVRPFLAHRDQRHDFFYESFQLAALERYAGEDTAHAAARPHKSWHQSLAGYFGSLPLQEPQPGMEKPITSTRKLSELPYHQAHGELWKALQAALSEFAFLNLKVRFIGPLPLIEDYRRGLQLGYPHDDLRLIQSALELSLHVIAKDPSELWGQLTGRLMGFEHPTLDALLQGPPASPCLEPQLGYLDGPGGSLVRTISGHDFAISCLAVTEDESFLLSGSGEAGPAIGKVIVTDLETGQERIVFTGHQYSIVNIALSSDGTTAASSSHDSIKIWDLRTGMERASIPSQGKGSLITIVQGKAPAKRETLLSADPDGQVRLYDLGTGNPIGALEGHNGHIQALLSSEEGDYAITGDDEGDIIIWDLKTNAEFSRCSGHSDRISRLKLSPAEDLLLSISGDKTLRVWSFPEGECLHTLSLDSHGFQDVCIFSGHPSAITAANDGTLREWNLLNGSQTRILGRHDRITRVALSAEDEEVVSTGFDQKIRVWNPETGRMTKEFTGYSSDITEMITLKQNRLVISGDFDRLIKIWDLDAVDIPRDPSVLKQVSAPFIPHPDGKHIIASRASSEILLVDVRSGEFHQRHPIQEKQRGGAAVAKDGSVAVVGGNVWDLKGNRLRGTLQRTGHELENVAVTPDGRYAVAYFRDAKTSRSYELLLWDLVRMKPTKIIKRFTSRSLPPVLTPSAAIMVRMKRTGSHQDHFINFAHPTSHGILEKRIGYFPQPVGQIHVSSDEQSLGFVSRSGHVITIWDLHKDREVAQLNGHQDRIGGIDVTMNRQMAVSGAWDGILNAWDLPSGRIKWTSKSLSNSVRDVRIMPGERYLASYGGAAVEIWDIESGKRMAGFTCEGSLHTLYTVPKSHYLLTQDQGGRIYVLAFLP